MGADIKSLRTRIHSVDSTLHLTKAMGLVASSKMRRATDNMLKGREYAAAVEQTVSLLSGSTECRKSPYMQKRDSNRVRLIVIAGDRGLAGGYNVNVFRSVTEEEGLEILPIGKRTCDRYGNGYASSERFSYEDAKALAVSLCSDFSEGQFDKLGIVSTKYRSLLSQEPELQWVLPLEPTEEKNKSGIIFEPDELTILNDAVPAYVAGILFAAVRESFCCEIAARRNAMDSAGKNAQQMIEDLQIAYNRARQGAITQEITEIVAGSGS